MRFRFGRRRRAKTVDAVVGAAPAGAAPGRTVVPEPAKAPAAVPAPESKLPADRRKQRKNDQQAAGELSPQKLDRALKRLRAEIPPTEDEGPR